MFNEFILLVIYYTENYTTQGDNFIIDAMKKKKKNSEQKPKLYQKGLRLYWFIFSMFAML